MLKELIDLIKNLNTAQVAGIWRHVKSALFFLFGILGAQHIGWLDSLVNFLDHFIPSIDTLKGYLIAAITSIGGIIMYIKVLIASINAPEKKGIK